MRLNRFISASLLTLLLVLLATSNSSAQHKVLFETFRCSCDPTGAAADASRKTFDDEVAAQVSGSGSKIIHFNHSFGNPCDYLNQTMSNNVSGRLNPPGNQTFWSAVDRSVFASTGKRASTDPGDWSSQIDADYSQSPIASLSSFDIKLDTIDNRNFTFSTDMVVTLNSSTSDRIVIRYAVLQDNVIDNLSGSTSNVIVNDAVRFLTLPPDTGLYVVFPSGGAAGATAHAIWHGSLYFGSGITSRGPYNWKNMRLIAYLEDQAGTNYSVINAAVAAPRLDNLPLPPQSLGIISDSLDGNVYAPGDPLTIFFSAQTIHMLMAYYSPDGGTTWDTASIGTASPLVWHLPATISPTKQGKIKLVEIGGDGIVSIEKGTFSIQPKPSLALLRPTDKDTARAGQHFKIQWTKFKADTVSKITLTLNGGTAKTIATNIADTSYDWSVPDTNAFATIQIVPTKSEQDAGAAAQTSAQFVILRTFQQGVFDGLTPINNNFIIRDVYPNPAQSGGTMTMRYTIARPSMTTLELFDILGHSVDHQSFYSSMTSGEFSFPVANLAPGSYILHMTDGANTASKRIEVVR